MTLPFNWPHIWEALTPALYCTAVRDWDTDDNVG